MHARTATVRKHQESAATPAEAALAAAADPFTTQIIRYALNSAANQMKRAAIRTSFSPVIYDALDFAVVLYDHRMRLLAQAPTLPVFMGTMSFCIEGAVAAVGGPGALEPGDVLIYNRPYGTGSHAQDCAIVMPVFLPDGRLVGYAANKAHWLDIGAKAPYCTDTTDVYQEGVVIPGVKLYRRGELNHDVHRMVLSNCRFQQLVQGDVNAQVASCHVGARELVRVIERFGLDTFERCVERMFQHGEKVVRDFVAALPDGTYRATCHMDDNGLDDAPIRFDVVVTIDGSTLHVDLGDAPDAQRGPVNCPLPSTVSGARVVLAMAAGGAHETPNEGHFRALEVITRPGSMFHPVEPQPCYLYGWPLMAAMEGLQAALSQATGGRLPSGSAADVVGILYYGVDPRTNEPFFGGSALPVGQGALPGGDGATMFVPALAQSRVQSAELTEAKTPVLVEKWEFAPDTAGPGRFRGGSGWDLHLRLRADAMLISTIERTREPSWGQLGGLSGAPNALVVEHPDGSAETVRKATDRPLRAGTLLRIRCGGGGGYGVPAERPVESVQRDLLHGLVTPGHVARHYPRAAKVPTPR